VVVDHHKVNLGPDMMEDEPEPRYAVEPNTHFVLGGAKALRERSEWRRDRCL